VRYLLEELDCFGGSGCGDWIDFDPLSKLVNRDKDVGEPTGSDPKEANRVKSLVGERLGGRYCA
jgi:hypothetical protein